MKLSDIYGGKKPAFSFEFFPPRSAKTEAVLFETIEELKALSPSFFSMTYGAGGSTQGKTLELGHRIKTDSGIETVCHLTCVGQSKDDVRAILREMTKLGMENVMALRGDPPRGETEWTPHPDGFRYASELVAEIVQMGDLSIAVAGFPEGHPESKDRESDLQHLKEKIDAGADVVVTQLFFDNEDFYRFEGDLRELGVKIPIIPGILPIVSRDQVTRFCEMCGATIPESLAARLEELDGNEGATRQLSIDYAAAQIEGLLEYGVPGVHIYSLNRSALSLAIFEKLKFI